MSLISQVIQLNSYNGQAQAIIDGKACGLTNNVICKPDDVHMQNPSEFKDLKLGTTVRFEYEEYNKGIFSRRLSIESYEEYDSQVESFQENADSRIYDEPQITAESIIRDIWGATQELSDLIDEHNMFDWGEPYFPNDAVGIAVINSIETDSGIFRAYCWKIGESNAIQNLINLNKLKTSTVSIDDFSPADMLHPESFLSLRKFDIVGFLTNDENNLILVQRLSLFEAIEILQANYDVDQMCELLEKKLNEEEQEIEIETEYEPSQDEDEWVLVVCLECGEESRSRIDESSYSHDNDSYDLMFITQTIVCSNCGHTESVEGQREGFETVTDDFKTFEYR